jgi:hypothetical protein
MIKEKRAEMPLSFFNNYVRVYSHSYNERDRISLIAFLERSERI